MSAQPCPSDLVLDRYVAGELDEGARHELEAHASACQACRDLLEERRAQARVYAEAPALPSRAVEALARVESERPARWWSRPRLWVPGLAAAVAAGLVAVVVLRHGLVQPGEGDGVRLKGSFALSAFVKRGEAVEPARSGEVFHPGDAVRFAYTSDRNGYLAIAGVDAKQVVSIYYPVEPREAVAAPAGQGVLPGSTILDETLGPETVIGLHCPRAFPITALSQRARPIADALRAGKDPGPLLPHGACRVARFELRKESGVGRRNAEGPAR
jgi:hypothetical protein